MVYSLWSGRRRIAIAASKLLDATPVRQQPRFEFILGGVSVKSRFLADPVTQFLSCVRSALELGWATAGVNIGQRDDRIVIMFKQPRNVTP